MSAFVVSDDCINKIVSWVNNVAMAGHSHKYWFVVRPLSKLGYFIDTDEECFKKLAADMFTMNCDGVEQRYGKGQAKEFRPLDFAYRYSPGFHVNVYQILKSLRCLLYQCTEGEVPEQNALYAALDTLSLNLSYAIVSNTKEYDAAQWD